MEFDHVLFIGFGGPEKPEDVKPFLEQVTRGLRIPEARLQEVVHHYEAIGGASPYNDYTTRLFNKVKAALLDLSISMPMFLGMRNWHPFLADTIRGIKSKGFQKGIAVVLAPHRADASFDKYVRSVNEAIAAAGEGELEYEYLKPWFDHPLFIEAQTAQVKKIYDTLSSAELAETRLIFSAHSIPAEMAAKSKYAEEIESSSRLVADSLGQREWSIAYQSRSGNPRDPWLEPEVSAVIKQMPASGQSTALVVPIGFLCDNAEVLYDLDIEARQAAEAAGVKYLRASTVMDHPLFARMFAELIQEHRDFCRC